MKDNAEKEKILEQLKKCKPEDINFWLNLLNKNRKPYKSYWFGPI